MGEVVISGGEMAVQSIEGVLTRAAAKRKGILVEVGVGRDSVGAGQSSEGEKERRRGDRVKGSSGKRQRSEEVQGWMKEKGRSPNPDQEIEK